MMRKLLICLFGCAAMVVIDAPQAWSVDLEVFEFNDPAGTPLASAANSVNPANLWIEDADMIPSDTRNGSYNIVKGSSALDSNYLQIANITSGTAYLVARISGWKFGDTLDTANLEEFRLAFLNDDTTPDFGATITAQFQIRRTSSGTVELVGDSLGTGSSNIVGTAPLTTSRSTPLTVALALDKTSNTYKVFYKDDTGPTQVLGIGAVAPTRDGNALRMAANNPFDEGDFDYPNFADEIFSVDRIALTNTNPFSDLITLEVNRDNGQMTLRNTSGAAINGVESYSITSTNGGLVPANWTPIAGGTNSSSKAEFTQTFGSPINLTNGQVVSLSTTSGGWLRSDFEDLQMVLQLTGGATRSVNVNFINNSGLRYMLGDFNLDNAITAADYLILAANAETNMSALTVAEASRLGDVTGNMTNDLIDFVDFKGLYETANGGGSFALMLAAIPEPSSLLLVGVAAVAVGCRRRRQTALVSRGPEAAAMNSSHSNDSPGDDNMLCFWKLSRVAAAIAVLLLAAAPSRATILEDFMFNETNGTILDETANSAHPGNAWLVHASTVESATFDGSFRINKQSATSQANNSLEIDNVTSGKVWLVAEIAGWSYTATASSPSERVRLGFLDNDPAAAGTSTVTAEFNIDRGSGGSGIVINGSALGSGGTNIGPSSSFSFNRSTPLAVALELDKDLNQYTVYFKDDNSSYQTLGTGSIGDRSAGVKRDGNSLRFAFTGTFGDTGEFFDINRIYLTDTNPTGGSAGPATLSLEVRSNGQVYIKNETANPISFDSYRIASGSNSLNFGGWLSLHDQIIDPFMGGDDAGETWTEAGGASDAALAESFLLSNSTLGPGEQFSLGSAFKIGGMQDLTFQYHDTTTGGVPNVVPTYITVAAVPGDYNQDGTVNAADYTIWRDTLGSTTDLRANGDNTGASANKIDQADYTYWKARFGNTMGSGSASLSAVPEPGCLAMLVGMVLSAGLRRRSTN